MEATTESFQLRLPKSGKRADKFSEPGKCDAYATRSLVRGGPLWSGVLLANGTRTHMARLINLPAVSAVPDAEAHGRADTARRRELFAWADAVLAQLGLDRAIARAQTIEALRRIVLDTDSVEVILVIRDALHPGSGQQRQEHFRGLREGALKLILKNRFAEKKKNREAELRRRKPTDWTDQLKLDKDGKIVGNLANAILILRESPDWKGVLGFDEFNVRVVALKPLPLEEAIQGAWSDHCDSMTRVWFLRHEIKINAGDVGRAVQAAARFNPFHPVRAYFDALVWDGVPRLASWLQDYLHVEDSAYARAIGPRFLVSGVARIYRSVVDSRH